MAEGRARGRHLLSVCVAWFINNISKPPTCTETYVMRFHVVSVCVCVLRVCVCVWCISRQTHLSQLNAVNNVAVAHTHGMPNAGSRTLISKSWTKGCGVVVGGRERDAGVSLGFQSLLAAALKQFGLFRRLSAGLSVGTRGSLLCLQSDICSRDANSDCLSWAD